jgi:hydroxypyruvate reductase
MNPADPRRELLLKLLQAGLARVNGRRCVRNALTFAQPEESSAPVWVIAVGKAAGAMTLGALDALGPSLERALIITKDGHVPRELLGARGIEILESAHPVPDERSLAAGKRLLEYVDELPAGVEPLFLISGGASSLVEVPEEGVTLEEVARASAAGLAEGISIPELNARRARLSRIKGGRLTSRLRGRPARVLFISDVPGDDPAVIGSGLLGPSADGMDRVERVIVASVDHAVEGAAAAAAELGLDVGVSSKRFDDDAWRLAVRFTHELSLNSTQVWVWGGESTIKLPESPGRGGRNQHLALAAAKLIAGQADLMLLAAGTDGTDGVTEDAGALVDSETCARIAVAELDPDACLRRADSATALAASGDLVHTGPTGTNVGDLVIGLKLSLDAARDLLGRNGTPRARVL